MESDGPAEDATIPIWRKWFFRWLSNNPELIEHVCRPATLAELFGRKKYEALDTAQEKAAMALPILSRLVWLWMKGAPLRDMELELGTQEKKLEDMRWGKEICTQSNPGAFFLVWIAYVVT